MNSLVHRLIPNSEQNFFYPNVQFMNFDILTCNVFSTPNIRWRATWIRPACKNFYKAGMFFPPMLLDYHSHDSVCL